MLNSAYELSPLPGQGIACIVPDKFTRTLDIWAKFPTIEFGPLFTISLNKYNLPAVIDFDRVEYTFMYSTINTSACESVHFSKHQYNNSKKWKDLIPLLQVQNIEQ